MTTVVPQEQIVTEAVSLSDIDIKDENHNQIRPLSQLEREHLKHSIKKHGVKVPVDLNKKLQAVDGHHRIELSIELGFEWIPARIHDFKDISESEFIYTVNIPRRHLNEFEKVELVEANLVSCDTKGRTRELIAAETGVSPATVARCTKINEKGSEEVKQRLRSGKARIGKEYSNIQKQQKRQQLLEEAAKNRNNSLPKGFKLILGDFRGKCKQIPNNSIDCIFTDPPYNLESLPLWEELGKVAFRVLKPGSSLVIMCGGYCLPQIMDIFRKAGLKYNWFCYMKHSGATQAMHGNHAIVCGKVILWFFKGDKLIDTTQYITDFVVSELPDKSLHEWAQSPKEAEHFLSRLVVENQIVLDPFMGSGTTGVAALKLKCQFIGIEIDEDSCRKANSRLSLAASQTPEMEVSA